MTTFWKILALSVFAFTFHLNPLPADDEHDDSDDHSEETSDEYPLYRRNRDDKDFNQYNFPRDSGNYNNTPYNYPNSAPQPRPRPF